MSVKVDVRSNIESVLSDVRAEREHIPVATYRALNRAIDASDTQAGREIRKVYNLKLRTVKAALKKLKASRNRLYAQLLVEGARIPLIEFDARWRQGQRGGATVKVLVAGGRKTVQGAFIASSSPGRGVFKRVGKARLPIRQLRSVSIPQAFSNDDVVTAVQTLAAAVFQKNFYQQLTFLRGFNG